MTILIIVNRPIQLTLLLPQHNMKHVAEPVIRRNIPHYPTELPKLNMVVPGPQMSFPVSTVPAFTITHRGTLPAIASKKCQSRLAKVNTELRLSHWIRIRFCSTAVYSNIIKIIRYTTGLH